MLNRLSLKNFVIVKTLDLDIESGFTVLTGETGAGKSILLDAIGLLLGERAEVGLIGQYGDKADVSGEFSVQGAVLPWLIEQDLFDEEGLQAGAEQCEVLIRRSLDKQGKSRAFINGIAVTLTQLRELADQMVHIHGQHAHQLLLKPALQRDLLDNHAQLGGLRDRVKLTHTQWHNAHIQRTDAERDAAQAGARLDALTWQLEGLSALAPEPNEWEGLSAEHGRLSHATTLLQGAAMAAEILTQSDEALANSVRSQISSLTSLARLDERLNESIDLLESALINIQEAGHALNSYASRADLDEGRWAQVDQRVSAWHEQARKLRVEPNELHRHWLSLQAEFETLHSGMDVDGLKAREEHAWQVYSEAAQALCTARRKAAKQLAKEVTASMQTLNMIGGSFDILMSEAAPSQMGIDALEFQVAGHAGVSLQALHKVASGGELARISLALAVITSAANPVPTLIFDEVDSGIGGAVAEVVGKLLATIGQTRQVLCVTHLPQVAAQGVHQWRVSKTTEGGNTSSSIDILSPEQRIDEIARMLGGVTITQATREHACEMLGSRLK